MLIKEVNDFCDRCIKELSSAGDKQELDISGLDDMLYVPDSLVEDDDNERSVGHPSGEVKDTGFSVTTELKKEDFIEKERAEESGDAIVFGEQTGGIVISSDSEMIAGVEQSGHRGSSSGNSKPGTDIKPVEKTDSDNTLFGPIKVNCRTFAQCEDGLWWHYIIIHTTTPIHNGFMNILVCGEVGDVSVNIAESDHWKFSENRVFGMELPLGVSRFKIRFSDNMKYTLRTELHYE